jgi:hypothetical protein
VSANRDRAEAERHWRKVYTGRASDALGWYQERPELSLAMIEATGFGPAAGIIDVGGGASRLADHLIGAGYSDITVLDIAASSLAAARRRLGPRAAGVARLTADATDWTPHRRDDSESLGRELGATFSLVETRTESHATPGGVIQSFQYSRFAHMLDSIQ